MAKTFMTVAQLREALANYDDDAPVYFTCDYGDYHHTPQALPIRNAEEFDENAIVKSAYSNSGLALDEDASDGSGASVVVLS